MLTFKGTAVLTMKTESEAYFARRDLGRLGLLALFYLTVCVFAPIFIGRAVLHRPLPHIAVVALFPIAWATFLVSATRIRTVWRVERLVRDHARRRGSTVDILELSRDTRIPAMHIEYVLGAMLLDGSVVREASRLCGPAYRVLDEAGGASDGESSPLTTQTG